MAKRRTYSKWALAAIVGGVALTAIEIYGAVSYLVSQSQPHYLVAGGAVVANRCLALLSKMFNLAELWGWRPEHSNPVRHIEKYKEVRREHYLSADEFARLGDALAESAEEGSESLFALAAIRLLIFTGARLGEILTLRWEYVDLEQRVLKLPDSKTGRKLIWLNPPAVEILTAMPRIKGNPYVIVGEREGTHLVNIQKV